MAMGIPESQLQVWSRQGDVAAAEATYQSIRQAFSAATCPLRETDFELYLHGSYRNGTNIRGDSDVDIVAQLNSTFDVDDSALSASEKDLLRSSCSREPYLWDEFRADALQALEACYGTSNVWETTRSLRVGGGPERLRADIVACLQYRKYERFRSMRDQRYSEGITFYAFKENRWLTNFPKIHYENGVSKNSQRRTRGRYWPTVRVFKNARTYLVDHGMIPEDLAPSHMLECLLYNVPDNRFAPTHQMTFLDVIAWLLGSFQDDGYLRFTFQHEQLPLFGDRPDQWVPDRAMALLDNLLELWKDW
jgi:hypothetical protein